MDDKERIAAVFAASDVEGIDLVDGVARFGGNPVLYAKIIRSFVGNIGAHMEKLSTVTKENLPGYAVEVHGVKGSLYGISANAAGNMAKELEFLAKAGNLEQVLAGNGAFAEAVRTLVLRLSALLDELGRQDAAPSGRAQQGEPDRALLGEMLSACRAFDVERMQEVLKELERFDYAKGGEIVGWLGDQVTAFAYGKIEERLGGML